MNMQNAMNPCGFVTGGRAAEMCISPDGGPTGTEPPVAGDSARSGVTLIPRRTVTVMSDYRPG